MLFLGYIGMGACLIGVFVFVGGLRSANNKYIGQGFVLMIAGALMAAGGPPSRGAPNGSPGMVAVGLLGVIPVFTMIVLNIVKKVQEYQMINNYNKREEKAKQEKTDKLRQEVKDGKWIFPAERFYELCQDGHIANLKNEYSVRKATQIAEQVIEETAPDIDLANFREYLKKDCLIKYLEQGEEGVRRKKARELSAQKQPRDANPNEQEDTFLERVSALSRLTGCDKRVKMLQNLIDDYSVKIRDMRKGEEALMQLGMIYADQQRKESSWAVVGGIVEGIAGPAAGIMAACNTMENNRKVQEFNASMRKASMDILSGIPSVAGNRFQLEAEQAKIVQKRDEAENKIVLSEPSAKDVWQNIKVGKATVQKNPSGVLEVSLPVTIQKPFALDVPNGIGMVVDGTIRGGVWFGDEYIGQVFFPLPVYGIPSNMTAEVTLDGMCGRSVELDVEYTVKIADTQTLWIMEA